MQNSKNMFEAFFDFGQTASDHPAMKKGVIPPGLATDLTPLIGRAAMFASSVDMSTPSDIEDIMFDAHSWLFFGGHINRYGAWAEDSVKRHPGLLEARYFQFDIRKIDPSSDGVTDNLDMLLPSRPMQRIAGHLICQSSMGQSYWDSHKDDLVKIGVEDAGLAKLILAGHLHRAEQRALETKFHETVLRHAILWAIADLVRICLYAHSLNEAGRAVAGAANMAIPPKAASALNVANSTANGPVHVRTVIAASEIFLKPLVQLGLRQVELDTQRAQGIAGSPRRKRRSKAIIEEMPLRCWGHTLTGVYDHVVASPALPELLHLEQPIQNRNRGALANALHGIRDYLANAQAMGASRQSAGSRLKPLPWNMTLAERHLAGFSGHEALVIVASQADEAISILQDGLAGLASGEFRDVMRRVQAVSQISGVPSKLSPAVEMLIEAARYDLFDERDHKPEWWDEKLADAEIFSHFQEVQKDDRKLGTARTRARAKLTRMTRRKFRRGAITNAQDNLGLSFRHRS